MSGADPVPGVCRPRTWRVQTPYLACAETSVKSLLKRLKNLSAQRRGLATPPRLRDDTNGGGR